MPFYELFFSFFFPLIGFVHANSSSVGLKTIVVVPLVILWVLLKAIWIELTQKDYKIRNNSVTQGEKGNEGRGRPHKMTFNTKLDMWKEI